MKVVEHVKNLLICVIVAIATANYVSMPPTGKIIQSDSKYHHAIAVSCLLECYFAQ